MIRGLEQADKWSFPQVAAAWSRGGALITDQLRIDFYGPHVDPACHVLRSGKALLPEPLGDLVATSAVVAINDDSLVHILPQFLDTNHHFGHRQEPRTVDFDQGVLVCLSTIQQQECVTLIKQRLDRVNIHFAGEVVRGQSHKDFDRWWEPQFSVVQQALTRVADATVVAPDRFVQVVSLA